MVNDRLYYVITPGKMIWYLAEKKGQVPSLIIGKYWVGKHKLPSISDELEYLCDNKK